MMNAALSAKTQARKETLLAGRVETRGKILEAAASLAPVQQDEVFLGVWSVKDWLAHLIGWDITNLERLVPSPSPFLEIWVIGISRGDRYCRGWPCACPDEGNHKGCPYI